MPLELKSKNTFLIYFQCHYEGDLCQLKDERSALLPEQKKFITQIRTFRFFVSRAFNWITQARVQHKKNLIHYFFLAILSNVYFTHIILKCDLPPINSWQYFKGE